jgi:hypothetical protein
VLAAFNRSHAMLGMGLSGGYDSRLILAAMLHLGIADDERVYVDSKIRPAHVQDLRIAKRIAAYFGFELNRPYPSPAQFAVFDRTVQRLSPASAIDEFRRTQAPNYHLAFLPELAYSDWTLSTRLTGGGGEIYRDFYKEDYPQPTVEDFLRGLTELSHKGATPDARHFAAETVSEELRRLDPEPGNWRSLRLHYTAWRNKIHFGRAEALHRPVVNPLVDMNVAIASHMLPQEAIDQRRLLFDLFMLLEPTLAFLEFDEPDKAFSKSAVEASPFFYEPLERPRRARSERRPQLVEEPSDPTPEFFSPEWVSEAALLLYDLTETAGEYLMESPLRPFMTKRYISHALQGGLRDDIALAVRFRQGIKSIAIADALAAIES